MAYCSAEITLQQSFGEAKELLGIHEVVARVLIKEIGKKQLKSSKFWVEWK